MQPKKSTQAIKKSSIHCSYVLTILQVMALLRLSVDDIDRLGFVQLDSLIYEYERAHGADSSATTRQATQDDINRFFG